MIDKPEFIFSKDEEAICQWEVWNWDKDNEFYQYRHTFNPRHLFNNLSAFGPFLHGLLTGLRLMPEHLIRVQAAAARERLAFVAERVYNPKTKSYEGLPSEAALIYPASGTHEILRPDPKVPLYRRLIKPRPMSARAYANEPDESEGPECEEFLFVGNRKVTILDCTVELPAYELRSVARA